MICEMCNTSYENLSSHIWQSHHIKIKIYYDTYIKRENEGICPICNKETTFLGLNKGYRIYCSKKCASNSPEVIVKTQNTNMIRYGVADTRNTKEVQEKVKQTNYLRYGASSPLKSPKVRLKIEQTNEIRYGNKNIFATDYGKNKIIQTLRKKYNVENAIFINGNIEKVNSIEATKKANETKRKNGTFNTSKIEEWTYSQLKSIFEEYNVKHNYYCERYPHNCDFYIVSLDLFIELNITWTHGGHWFDETNEEDINKLTKWKEKSENSTYYKYAIKTWTNYDVIKRHDIEKLNHLVFWTEKEVKEWIKEKAIHL